MALLLFAMAAGFLAARYESERIRIVAESELGKLDAIRIIARDRRAKALTAFDLMHVELTGILRRPGPVGSLSVAERQAAIACLDDFLEQIPEFTQVRLLNPEGELVVERQHFALAGVPPPSRAASYSVSDATISYRIGSGALASLSTAFMVSDPEVQTQEPYIRLGSEVSDTEGRAVASLVADYALGPFYDETRSFAADYPRTDLLEIWADGTILQRGDLFTASLSPSVDGGVLRLGDLNPPLWRALNTYDEGWLKDDSGLYVYSLTVDYRAISESATIGNRTSVIFIPAATLNAGSLIQGWSGALIVAALCAMFALGLWAFWRQLAARWWAESKDRDLASALSRLEHSAEFSRTGLLEIDLPTGKAEANAVFFEMHHIPEERQGSLEAEHLFDAMVDEGLEDHRQALRELSAEGGRMTLDYDVVNPAGKTRRYRAVATRLSGKGARPQLRLVVNDISDLYEQSEQLKQTNENQRRMFRIIAHELRTPAAALQMMIDEMSGTAPHKSDLNTASRHLLNVIDDLRASINPLEDVKTDITDFSLETLLREVELQVGGLFANQSMTLQIGIHGEIKYRYCSDTYRLRTVISNLLRNAVFHSGGSRAVVTVDVEAASDDRDRVIIKVMDDGRGIPESQVATLMRPFERGDTTAGGTGVGLFIAKTWVGMLGGTLDYRVAEIGGACFVIDLELERAEEQPAAGPLEAREEDALRWLEGKHALLVEDDRFLRMATSRLLSRDLKLEVTAVVDGQEAVEFLTDKSVDLIVTDYFMPRLDGRELIESLRAEGEVMPIIALTAATIGEERQELIRAGASGVLSKPLDISAFCTIVAQELLRGTLEHRDVVGTNANTRDVL